MLLFYTLEIVKINPIIWNINPIHTLMNGDLIGDTLAVIKPSTIRTIVTDHTRNSSPHKSSNIHCKMPNRQITLTTPIHSIMPSNSDDSFIFYFCSVDCHFWLTSPFPALIDLTFYFTLNTIYILYKKSSVLIFYLLIYVKDISSQQRTAGVFQIFDFYFYNKFYLSKSDIK